MTVQVLSEDQKDVIVWLFVERENTQTSIAQQYNVSERTIHRVLTERGVAPIKPEAAILAVCKARGLYDPKMLEMCLDNQCNTENIIQYLSTVNTAELLKIIDTSYHARARKDVIKNFNQHPSNAKPL